MEHAYARRPRGDDKPARQAAPALRAVPDDLTPAERRDWQNLAERRNRRERAERAQASRRRPAPPPVEAPPRRAEAPPPAPAEPSTRARREYAAPAASVPSGGPAASAGAPAAYAPARTPPARTAPARTAPAPQRARTAVARPAPPRRQEQAPPVRHRTVVGEVEARAARPPRRRRAPWLAGIASGPDRLALWAVVLCLFMALVAAATARGEEPNAGEPGPAAAASAAESAPPAAAPRR